MPAAGCCNLATEVLEHDRCQALQVPVQNIGPKKRPSHSLQAQDLPVATRT